MTDRNEKEHHPLDTESSNQLHEKICEHFKKVNDPRIDRRKRHKLLDIIFIAIAAVICGANNWKGVEVFARSKQAWLKTILELPNGIPSYVTFWRIFRRISTKEFQDSFAQWVQAAFKGVKGGVMRTVYRIYTS